MNYIIFPYRKLSVTISNDRLKCFGCGYSIMWGSELIIALAGKLVVNGKDNPISNWMAPVYKRNYQFLYKFASGICIIVLFVGSMERDSSRFHSVRPPATARFPLLSSLFVVCPTMAGVAPPPNIELEWLYTDTQSSSTITKIQSPLKHLKVYQ